MAPPPAPAPMPASLNVAVTDSPDSIAAWLSDRGAYRVTARAGDTVQLEPVIADAAPALALHRVPARGARDAIDAGVDILLTGDPETIAYAATRTDLTSVPSAWNRTYVLLVRGGVAADSGHASARDSLRTELATRAVRVEARPAPVEFGGDSCAAPDAASLGADDGTVPSRPRIIYARTDDVARALAARLVALGATRRDLLAALTPLMAQAGDSLRAEGVDVRDVTRAMQAGDARAAIVAIPAAHPDSCGAGGRSDAIALIQTRERLIARRSLTGRVIAALVQAVGDSAQAGP